MLQDAAVLTANSSSCDALFERRQLSDDAIGAGAEHMSCLSKSLGTCVPCALDGLEAWRMHKVTWLPRNPQSAPPNCASIQTNALKRWRRVNGITGATRGVLTLEAGLSLTTPHPPQAELGRVPSTSTLARETKNIPPRPKRGLACRIEFETKIRDVGWSLQCLASSN